MPWKKRCKPTRRPHIETLERREVPATWGIAWPDAQHLTLSFVPDGTSVEGQSSQLFQTLDAQLGVGKWETSILNAFQTWAENSNINIGLVADGGQPLGTAGAAQGDARFGDIRVSAAPLPAGVAAITAPYDPSTGTISGDMIINSNDNFTGSSGLDLFTVALHEAGHDFGFADSSDPTSFMYNVYQGPQTTLSPAAISALQRMYGGPRNIGGIDSFLPDSSLSPNDVTSLLYNASTMAPVAGDLESAQDADYYQFRAPATTWGPNGIDIQVQTAGISQLIPRVVVTDPSGKVIANASAATSADGGISVHFNPGVLVPNQVDKIRVDGPTDDLDSIGSYILAIAPTISSVPTSVNLSNATALAGKGPVGPTPQTVNATISSMKQADYYSFTTPASTPNGVSVQLQAYGIGLIAPQIAVYTAAGSLVGQASATDLNNPAATLLLKSLTPNTRYVIKAATGTVNAYQFGIYQVSVSTNTGATGPPTLPILQTPWLGSNAAKPSAPNTSLANAATLITPAGYAPGTFFAAMAGIADATTAQFYDVKPTKSATTAYMTVVVQTLGTSGFQPWVVVLDKSGNAVPSRVLAQSNGVSVVQVPYTTASDYIIKVTASASSGSNPAGNYYLSTTFGTVASSLGTLASGTLGPAVAGSAVVGTSASLTTPSSELYEFVLAGNATKVGSDATLRLTVTDSSGNVVATLTSLAGEAASLNVLLGAGTYSIDVDAYSPSGSSLGALSYQLSGTNLTDPIRIASPASGGSSPPQT